jgi:pimeloyl-ACP methyl ester carboxylesterase
MYSATPCKLLSLNSGHSAYFSRPDELAEKILIAGGDDVAALTSRWKAGSTSARPTSPFSNERSSMQTSNHGDSEMKDRRKYADTPSGRIAYIENGEGPVALFLHGILLNGYLWHRQLEKLGSTRRCIALDLLAHGATEISATQDVSYRAQAQMIAQFLDALTISAVDLVANDSATAIAQIFAANYPGRVHSLTLTDGDTHDNWPPEAFKAFLTSATQGQLGQILETMITQKEMFRSDKGLGLGFEHPERIPDEAIEYFLRPLLSSPRRLRDLERFCEAAFNNEQTTEIEPKLKSLKCRRSSLGRLMTSSSIRNGQIGSRRRSPALDERSSSRGHDFISRRSGGKPSIKSLSRTGAKQPDATNR